MRRLHIVSTLAALAIAWTPMPGTSAPEPPSAVLLGCQGEVVVVKNGGETIKGTFGMALEPGDEVRTGKDSQAEIHFDNGQWVQIGANSSTQVHGRKGTVATSVGERSFEVVQNFLRLKDSQGTSSLARLRSGAKHATLRGLSPVQTKIRENLPTFRWSASDPTAELRLILYIEKGIHWKKDVSAGTKVLAYSPDGPPLVPGVTYSWVLETTDPLVFPAARSEAGFFEILSSEEGDEVDAALGEIANATQSSGPTYHVLCASVYFDHGLMEDAIAETVKALEVDPDNSHLHAILARLYAESGRTEEALKEYDQLLEKR